MAEMSNLINRDELRRVESVHPAVARESQLELFCVAFKLAGSGRSLFKFFSPVDFYFF